MCETLRMFTHRETPGPLPPTDHSEEKKGEAKNTDFIEKGKYGKYPNAGENRTGRPLSNYQ